jgi:hypothetical protein
VLSPFETEDVRVGILKIPLILETKTQIGIPSLKFSTRFFLKLPHVSPEKSVMLRHSDAQRKVRCSVCKRMRGLRLFGSSTKKGSRVKPLLGDKRITIFHCAREGILGRQFAMQKSAATPLKELLTRCVLSFKINCSINSSMNSADMRKFRGPLHQGAHSETFRGSFSAVSTPPITRVGSFCSAFQALHNFLNASPEFRRLSHHFAKFPRILM